MDRRVSDRIAEMQKINPQTVESKMDATTVAANYHKIVAEERRKMRTPGRATTEERGGTSSSKSRGGSGPALHSVDDGSLVVSDRSDRASREPTTRPMWLFVD